MSRTDSTIQLIIETNIEKLYNINPEIIKQHNKTLDELIIEISSNYTQIEHNIQKSYPELYELFQQNKYIRNLFVDDFVKYQLLGDKYLSEEYLTEGLEITLPYKILPYIVLFIFLMNKKIPGRIYDLIKKGLFKIGKRLYTNYYHMDVIDKFFKNIPPECIKKIRTIEIKQSHFSSPNEMAEEVLKKLKLSLKTYSKLLGTGPLLLRELYQKEPELFKCALEYLISYVEVSLSLFYECLFNSKKFMDLINIKKLHPDELLQLDKFLTSEFTKIAKSECYTYYANFKFIYQLVLDVIDYAFKTTDPEYNEYMSKLHRSISEASKYAQKLLDEGKKKENNPKDNKSRR